MSDVARFRELVEGALGLSPAALSDERLAEVLEHRLRALGCESIDAYESRLSASSGGAREVAALAELLTVGETYLFREPKQIEALVDVALPVRIRARAGAPVRILSAGCATGEEAYTLAIATAERASVLGSPPIKIVGVDVNPAALRKAKRARYSPWAFRAAPPGVRERCFVAAGECAEVRRDLRQMVSFEERNLLTPDPAFWAEGSFDAIFCRNVLIYLSRARMIEVIERLTRALVPGGYLFLGHSESLRGLSEDFDTLHTHDAFYYRRRGEPQLRPSSPALRAVVEPPSSGRAKALPAPACSPSDRPLAVRSQEAIERKQPPPPPPSRAGLDAALALLKQERFSEALEALYAMRRPESDPEIRLLIAVLLSHQGKIREAERVCCQALDDGEADAGTHYLLGLCREHAGDLGGAARHYRSAIQSDRGFAMPHLRLARLARRAGDLPTAWAETRRAAELFAREGDGRVLLFGGGFQREALVELCHAELRAYGARR